MPTPSPQSPIVGDLPAGNAFSGAPVSLGDVVLDALQADAAHARGR